MDENPLNIALVILAAGASSRMGHPKQLLKWGNTTLINHAIKTASRTNSKEVIVVLGANFEAVKNEIKAPWVTILKNEDWKQGIGKSIACASEYILRKEGDFDGILITLADQPFVTSSFLNVMIKGFIAESQNIIATSYGKHKNGVPVLFHKGYLPELSVLDDDEGAKKILKKHRVSVKAFLADFKNSDIDTKEDYDDLSGGN